MRVPITFIPLENWLIKRCKILKVAFSVFHEIRGRYHCVFKQGFGPLHKVMEYKVPMTFLARTQETQGKVVEG